MYCHFRVSCGVSFCHKQTWVQTQMQKIRDCREEAIRDVNNNPSETSEMIIVPKLASSRANVQGGCNGSPLRWALRASPTGNTVTHTTTHQRQTTNLPVTIGDKMMRLESLSPGLIRLSCAVLAHGRDTEKPSNLKRQLVSQIHWMFLCGCLVWSP